MHAAHHAPRCCLASFPLHATPPPQSLLAALPLSVVVIRILTSGLFWRQHGLWSRVIYGPLPLKIVLYRYIAQVSASAS